MADTPEPNESVIGLSVPEGMDFSGRMGGPQPPPCTMHRYGTRANTQRSTLPDTPPSVIDVDVGRTRHQRFLSAPYRVVDRPDRNPVDRRVLTPQPAVTVAPIHDYWTRSRAADNLPPPISF